MNEIYSEIGWVLIYVFAFGISDFFIKEFVSSNFVYIYYYICIGLVGSFIIYYNKNDHRKNTYNKI